MAEPTQQDIADFNYGRDIYWWSENVKRAEAGEEPLTEKEATDNFGNLLTNLADKPLEIFLLRIAFDDLVQRVTALEANA